MDEIFIDANKYMDTTLDWAIPQVKQMLGVFRRGIANQSRYSFSRFQRQCKGYTDPWSDLALLFSML